MEWNGNFGMEYGRCQNGMKWKISRMEWKTIFHTILNFLHGIFRKMNINVGSDKQYSYRNAEYVLYLPTYRGSSVVCIVQTVYELPHSEYIAICSMNAVADDFDSVARL